MRNTETKNWQRNKQTNEQTNETATTKRRMTEEKKIWISHRDISMYYEHESRSSHILSYHLCSILSVLLFTWSVCVYVHFVHLPQSSFYFRFSVASRMTQKKCNIFTLSKCWVPFDWKQRKITANSIHERYQNEECQRNVSAMKLLNKRWNKTLFFRI